MGWLDRGMETLQSTHRTHSVHYVSVDDLTPDTRKEIRRVANLYGDRLAVTTIRHGQYPSSLWISGEDWGYVEDVAMAAEDLGASVTRETRQYNADGSYRIATRA
jgi:hypothetical protein